MDFETVYPALPRFPGMRPYDHVPFQWSVQRQEQPGGATEQFEFLAESASDPRRPFLDSLLQALLREATRHNCFSRPSLGNDRKRTD